MSHKQKLSAGKKIKIVQMYLDGKISMSEVARQNGIDRKTISEWVRNYEDKVQ